MLQASVKYVCLRKLSGVYQHVGNIKLFSPNMFYIQHCNYKISATANLNLEYHGDLLHFINIFHDYLLCGMPQESQHLDSFRNLTFSELLRIIRNESLVQKGWWCNVQCLSSSTIWLGPCVTANLMSFPLLPLILRSIIFMVLENILFWFVN